MRMKTDMESLDEENENLKKENERLKHVHGSMNGTLQMQTKLIDQLKGDLDKLNDEYKKQNVLVQRLSELLACPDLQLENERLKLENSQLRRYAGLDYRVVLAEENVKLKLENKVLRVQNDALCGKLISDSDKKHASELAG
ncbi:hypothetical protein SLEP1_g52742 [Rubroshorea leprosula]|uniref:Uncharacterized protein n=1 Tax=Rubroshorea leprosula TaxID=152421 RepID=A0AAV5M9H4_9ROSI|nr:hypothetical protein SLEP1_g52742 [Rubroshorea leprosula]